MLKKKSIRTFNYESGLRLSAKVQIVERAMQRML